MTDISEEYKKMLRQLHEESHPEKQPGEFTISEYANAQIPPLARKIAARELDYMVNAGKLEKPPKRYIDGRLTVVYRKLA
jgi:hypothetical protein